MTVLDDWLSNSSEIAYCSSPCRTFILLRGGSAIEISPLALVSAIGDPYCFCKIIWTFVSLIIWKLGASLLIVSLLKKPKPRFLVLILFPKWPCRESSSKFLELFFESKNIIHTRHLPESQRCLFSFVFKSRVYSLLDRMISSRPYWVFLEKFFYRFLIEEI